MVPGNSQFIIPKISIDYRRIVCVMTAGPNVKIQFYQEMDLIQEQTDCHYDKFAK
jgi:hypothetical protein